MANNRLVIVSGGKVGVIFGVYDVFGTNNGSETVRLFNGGTAFLQGDFGRGGDIIEMGDIASDYTVRLEGSNVIFTSASDGITAYVPMTTGNTIGTTISFEDANGNYVDSRALRFNGTNIVLGDQVVTGTATAVNPIAPAQSGQSALLAEPAHDDETVLSAPGDTEVIAFAALAAPAPEAVGGFDGSAIHFSATDLPPQFYSKLGFEAGMTSFVVNFA